MKDKQTPTDTTPTQATAPSASDIAKAYSADPATPNAQMLGRIAKHINSGGKADDDLVQKWAAAYCVTYPA